MSAAERWPLQWYAAVLLVAASSQAKPSRKLCSRWLNRVRSDRMRRWTRLSGLWTSASDRARIAVATQQLLIDPSVADRCARPRPKQNFVAVGTNDGQIAMYQLNFTTVHGLYQVGGSASGTATLPPISLHEAAHSCSTSWPKDGCVCPSVSAAELRTTRAPMGPLRFRACNSCRSDTRTAST